MIVLQSLRRHGGDRRGNDIGDGLRLFFRYPVPAGGYDTSDDFFRNKGRRSLAFFKDARIEVRKVVWPTRQEAMQTTVAVLFMVVLVAIMLWLFDMFLGWGVSKLLA